MNKNFKILVKTQTNEGQIGEGAFEMIEFSEENRRKRAIKAGLLSLAAAIAFIFLPIVHFVLVPAALLTAPILAYFFYSRKTWVLESQILCPACQHPNTFSARPRLEFPLQDLCQKCRKQFSITPTP